MKIISSLLDLVYPPSLYCICCGKIINKTRTYTLCNDCMSECKWANGPSCKKCGKPLSERNPRNLCFNCIENSHQFDRGYCCTEYGSIERSIAFALKYKAHTEIAPIIAEIMFDRMISIFPDLGSDYYDYIVPIPMYRGKRLIRGFNQAELISGEFAKMTGIKHMPNILIRTRDSHALKGLDPDKRRNVIQGAFAINEDSRSSKNGSNNIIGKRFLLIDDIYTTGATVDEASRILREGGASRIDFLSFASGADVVK